MTENDDVHSFWDSQRTAIASACAHCWFEWQAAKKKNSKQSSGQPDWVCLLPPPHSLMTEKKKKKLHSLPVVVVWLVSVDSEMKNSVTVFSREESPWGKAPTVGDAIEHADQSGERSSNV